jgi:hypothetical protein
MARTPVPSIAGIDPELLKAPVVTRDDSRPSDRLRFELAAIYVTHPDGVTLEELAADPRFAGHASLTSLKRWASEDGWVNQRAKVLAEYGDKIKEKLRKELYSRITNVRIGQLAHTDELLKNMLEGAKGADVKSAEGAAKVAIDLMKWQLELSKDVAQELVPSGGGSAIDPRNDATDEEMLQAAKIVLMNRRKKVLDSMTIDAEAVEVPMKALPAPAPTPTKKPKKPKVPDGA